MTLSIKHDEYAFLIRSKDLMFSTSLWKEFQCLSIKHWIKLILYENDAELLKFKRRPV